VTGFADSDLSEDAFLGGALKLLQPRRGYRAGVDPLLLAAAVPATRGQSVLELGCGAGAAILSLGSRVPGLSLTGVEVQDPYADLARRNAARNGLEIEVHTADLAALPRPLKARSFDHVIANPPYFRAGAHLPADDAGRAMALGDTAPLPLWIEVAARRLKPRGYLHLINRTDRLPEMLAVGTAHLGSIEALPLSARLGRAPELVILRMRKDGRAPFRLHAPVILHDGDRHVQDGADDYRPEIAAVLREGAALLWPSQPFT
tara:strand:- start:1121 stop:1903 length:783 start_codon:yes stop_codon:yes gene_type:complete